MTGGFEENEASSGSIACLNIWSGIYSSATLLAFSQCKNKGDIHHLDTAAGTMYGEVTSSSGTLIPSVFLG